MRFKFYNYTINIEIKQQIIYFVSYEFKNESNVFNPVKTKWL
jgi:hypothetical protein